MIILKNQLFKRTWVRLFKLIKNVLNNIFVKALENGYQTFDKSDYRRQLTEILITISSLYTHWKSVNNAKLLKFIWKKSEKINVATSSRNIKQSAMCP